MRLLVLVVLACGTATADPALPTIDDVIAPTIRIERAREVTVERGEVMWVTFGVPNYSQSPLAIHVPAGTRVVGLEIESDGQEPVWGGAVAATRVLPPLADSSGAEIAWDSESGGVDHLRLNHVGRDCSQTDVVRRCSERITLALVLPAIDHVDMVPAPARVDGLTARSARIAIAPHGPADATPAVSKETSLVALTQPGFHLRFCCAPPRFERELDKSMIRRRMKLRQDGLRYCYELARLRLPDLAGTAELQFTIAPTGAVVSVAVEGTLPDSQARACLAREVETWEFPETDETVVVHYPLTFEPI